MTARSAVAAVTVALSLTAGSSVAAAQQSTPVQATPRGSGLGQGSSSGSGRGATGRGQTTPEATVDNRSEPRSRVVAQGFSVVLVLADLQAAGGEDDVPPAARKALLDMKEFLPYKSYRLLDAAWILNSSTRATTRLRGPEDRDYELEIMTQPMHFGGQRSASTANDSRVYVSFALRDGGPAEPAAGRPGSNQASEREAEVLRDRVAAVQAELQNARQRYNSSSPEVRRLETELRDLQMKLNESTRGESTRRMAYSKTNQGLMNTSFTMEPGETVVVGTSRLKGTKALIALLTAVPPRGNRVSKP
jgi:hypothetical protein